MHAIFFLQDHVNERSMGQIDHAVSRQEPLPQTQRWRTENRLGDSFECVDVVGLHVKGLLLSCGKGAYSMAFKHSCDRVGRKHPERVVKRAAGAGRPVTRAPGRISHFSTRSARNGTMNLRADGSPGNARMMKSYLAPVTSVPEVLNSFPACALLHAIKRAIRFCLFPFFYGFFKIFTG